ACKYQVLSTWYRATATCLPVHYLASLAPPPPSGCSPTPLTAPWGRNPMTKSRAPDRDHLLPAVLRGLVLGQIDPLHGDLGATHRTAVVLVGDDYVGRVHLGWARREHPDQHHRHRPDDHGHAQGQEDVEDAHSAPVPPRGRCVTPARRSWRWPCHRPRTSSGGRTCR